MLILYSGRPYGTDSSRPRTPSELLYSDRRLRSKSSPAATILYQNSQTLTHAACALPKHPKTVMKWRKRAFLYDAPMGPKVPRSTVLSAEEEALAVAFRKHTLLPLDDCLYALQATIPHLTRSSLHRLFQRHEISRLPAIEGETGRKKAFKRYPIGYFHIDIAEVRTEEGKLHWQRPS